METAAITIQDFNAIMSRQQEQDSPLVRLMQQLMQYGGTPIGGGTGTGTGSGGGGSTINGWCGWAY